MKLFKEIFARVWALWGMISFVATFLIIFIPAMCCYLIPDNKGQYIFIRIARLWMHVWLRLVGCPIRVKGLENFKKKETYIVTCNHNALLDPTLSCPFIPGANKTIAKDSFAKVPLFGWYYKKGAVLVNRKNNADRTKSYEKMKQVLAAGMHMSLYPEGTRNRTREPLKSFYDGAFKLSIESGKSIIPALIFNTKKAMPINKTFYLLPQKLEIHFLEPIEPANKSTEHLKEEVFNVMKHYFITHQQ